MMGNTGVLDPERVRAAWKGHILRLVTGTPERLSLPVLAALCRAGHDRS